MSKKEFPRLLTRQKFLAAYYYLIGRKASKSTLHFKHMFLVIKEFLSSDMYSFIPYKFGAYSFTMKNDLKAMEKKGLLNNADALRYYMSQLDDESRQKILDFYDQYRDILFNVDEIVKHSYEEYPYYAVNSEIVSRYPVAERKAKKEKRKIAKKTEHTLFTIGYESRSIEDFFNLLIENNIKALVDVRSNRSSMKYGFSNNTLTHFCSSLGIKYIPFSELGIVSEKRKSLDTQDDYNRLFREYKKSLSGRKKYIESLFKVLGKEKRVALMCFELHPHMCHRTVLAKTLLDGSNIPSIHL